MYHHNTCSGYYMHYHIIYDIYAKAKQKANQTNKKNY